MTDCPHTHGGFDFTGRISTSGVDTILDGTVNGERVIALWAGVTAIDVTSPTLPAMAEKPDHETLERVLKTEPLKVLSQLPDCIARRRAEELVDIVEQYGHEAREKVRPEPQG